MKATGRTTKLTVRGDLYMLMEMCTMALGRTTRHTDSEFTVIWMEHVTRASGKRTNNMAKDLKRGLMGPAIKVNM